MVLLEKINEFFFDTREFHIEFMGFYGPMLGMVLIAAVALLA